MTLWEFGAARDHWLLANGEKRASNATISDDRLAELGIKGFERDGEDE